MDPLQLDGSADRQHGVLIADDILTILQHKGNDAARKSHVALATSIIFKGISDYVQHVAYAHKVLRVAAMDNGTHT
jgi:hypothetical protein